MEGFNALGTGAIASGLQSDTGSHAEDVQQFLTFMLDNQEYGVDILSVQEIRGRGQATRIPNVPNYIRGVINLRGTIVPVIDLRVRFGMAKTENGEDTMSIVVLKVEGRNGSSRAVGIMVDAVSDVYSLTADKVKPAPDMGNDMENEYASGLAIVDDNLIILLDARRLLASGDVISEHQSR